MAWANIFGGWILSKPPLGTFTLSGASAQSGEYANMTCTIVNLDSRDAVIPVGDYKTRRAIANDPNREMRGFRMEILSKRGEGSVGTAYTALLYHPPPPSDAHPVPVSKPPVRCILKVSCLWHWTETEDAYGYTLEKARKAILNEPKVYKHLGDKGLQGSVVPRYWGIGVLDPPGARMAKAKVICSVMEDAGECLPDEEKDNVETRVRIRTLYRKLHAAEVAHGDVEWRHILRGADGRVRLIDFDQGWIRRRHKEEFWPGCTHADRRDVERLWNPVPYRDLSWYALWEGEMDESPVPHRVYPPKQTVPWKLIPAEMLPVETHLDEGEVEDALDT